MHTRYLLIFTCVLLAGCPDPSEPPPPPPPHTQETFHDVLMGPNGLITRFRLAEIEHGGDRSAEPTTAFAGSENAPADMAARIERLEQMLGEEREARAALEDTLAMLFDELDSLDGGDEREAAEQEARQAGAREPGTR